MQKDFLIRLKQRLSGDLPGLISQLKMVPEARRKEIEEKNNAGDARLAAVLICLYPENSKDLTLILIRRNEYDGVHSGQISFPGGQYEEGDTDLIHTALREAEEETNIRVSEVKVLGNITPVYIPPSNFYVLPVVGWLERKPDLKRDPSEVSEILNIPLSEFLGGKNIVRQDIAHREFSIVNVPCFDIRGNIIWGATAMMLMELADLVKPLINLES